MEGAYARKVGENGRTTAYYKNRADYVQGRETASRSRARQRQRINRSVRGRVA